MAPHHRQRDQKLRGVLAELHAQSLRQLRLHAAFEVAADVDFAGLDAVVERRRLLHQRDQHGDGGQDHAQRALREQWKTTTLPL